MSSTEATYANSIRTVAAGSPDEVKEYYGEVLSKTDDLKTGACMTSTRPDDFVLEAIGNVHEAVRAKYYGCGLVVPQQLAGLRVLDLGCGSGRDVYMLAQWVGASGFVMGIDMTASQLEVAEKYIDWHTSRNNYPAANVSFKQGYIERLSELALEDNSFDMIISNCVINLSPDKEAVLKEAYRILKPGGEIFFSDVYSSRRISQALRQDRVLWGECLSGALYWNDFLRLSKQCGFADPRTYEDRPLAINNSAIEKVVGHIDFFSATYRLWKLPDLEPDCEDYGQVRLRPTTITTTTTTTYYYYYYYYYYGYCYCFLYYYYYFYCIGCDLQGHHRALSH
jgi:arsenite methyltransferase